MSVFPFTDPQELTPVDIDEELPVAQEWAWDFERRDFKKRDGKMYLVEEDEAIKIWIWKIFQTPRYRHLVYDWDYGHELEDLIGIGSLPLVESEAERMVDEAMFPSLEDYVESIEDINIILENDLLTINFKVITIYGEVEISV